MFRQYSHFRECHDRKDGLQIQYNSATVKTIDVLYIRFRVQIGYSIAVINAYTV